MSSTTTTQQLTKWKIPPVFYVGGQYIRDQEGTHMSGQMCVRHYGADDNDTPGTRPTVIFIHGAAQTGTHFEVTPDGRPGLALLQAQEGWSCYVVDLVGVGRSRYHAADMGALKHYTAEELQAAFTAPAPDAWPTARLHTQWPGRGTMGDAHFDAFYASQVGHNADYKAMERLVRSAARALLTRTGPAYLVTHSQSGPLGWHIADECPELVRGIVALEPHGPPYELPDVAPFNKNKRSAALVGTLHHPFGITSTPLSFAPALAADATQLSYERFSPETPPLDCGFPTRGCRQTRPPRQLVNLASIPVLLVTAEASYHASYDHLTADFLRDAGVPVEHVYLADRGIRGNGHLMAIEANNEEIQKFINQWLTKAEGSLRSET
ncbi:uncharacterized protein Z520_02812 [Fonsecaea multimorphosa CBS 102226]|uniref:AB hydrolase-1 domain-containing protein n=1 Tax=Fonsecaea multimorphosa CBS 102226 TaxID=1442371 RepID=A0A0D2KDF9_9EURO|nr:uncharacterized protein Z520_02812 [Fonsecaea multimorphosa CBS 102226]KIY01260.1 hypothetical protein Z520_02812 [Fonsecaea multimorphosa CBS 102226]OAL28539.1 hypothetical protein AYO22_02733 [Fonsecaea multimorphosa]